MKDPASIAFTPEDWFQIVRAVRTEQPQWADRLDAALARRTPRADGLVAIRADAATRQEIVLAADMAGLYG